MNILETRYPDEETLIKNDELKDFFDTLAEWFSTLDIRNIRNGDMGDQPGSSYLYINGEQFIESDHKNFLFENPAFIFDNITIQDNEPFRSSQFKKILKSFDSKLGIHRMHINEVSIKIFHHAENELTNDIKELLKHIDGVNALLNLPDVKSSGYCSGSFAASGSFGLGPQKIP
jgi:hypothetical protein